jgi:hypothetical protein
MQIIEWCIRLSYQIINQLFKTFYIAPSNKIIIYLILTWKPSLPTSMHGQYLEFYDNSIYAVCRTLYIYIEPCNLPGSWYGKIITRMSFQNFKHSLYYKRIIIFRSGIYLYIYINCINFDLCVDFLAQM